MAFNPAATAHSLADLRDVLAANPQSTTKAAPVAPHKENTVNQAVHTLAATPVSTTPIFDFTPRSDETADPEQAIRLAEKSAWRDQVRGILGGALAGVGSVCEYLCHPGFTERTLASAGITASLAPASTWRAFANRAKEIRADASWFKDGRLQVNEFILVVPRMDKDTIRFFRSADGEIEAVVLCKDDKCSSYCLFAVSTKDDKTLHQWNFDLKVDVPRSPDDYTLSSELVLSTDVALGSVKNCH